MKVGDRVGPWRLERQIGWGGNASVWYAIDDQGNAVAVKVLKQLKRGEAFSRFRDEIAALRELGDHPGVLPVLDSYLPNAPSDDRSLVAVGVTY